MAVRHKRSLWRFWGYGVLVVMLLAVLGHYTGPAFYVLFSAPVYCGAINRKRGTEVEFCRNNSAGLLLGCHLRNHKWQKLSSMWWSLGWRQKTRGLWSSPSAQFATLTGVIGTLTGIYGMLFDHLIN
jgi:hypothetical protein